MRKISIRALVANNILLNVNAVETFAVMLPSKKSTSSRKLSYR